MSKRLIPQPYVDIYKSKNKDKKSQEREGQKDLPGSLTFAHLHVELVGFVLGDELLRFLRVAKWEKDFVEARIPLAVDKLHKL